MRRPLDLTVAQIEEIEAAHAAYVVSGAFVHLARLEALCIEYTRTSPEDSGDLGFAANAIAQATEARNRAEGAAEARSDMRNEIEAWGKVQGALLQERSKMSDETWKRVMLAAAFACGVIFLFLLLLIYVFIPRPSVEQVDFFRTLTALSAAGFGGFVGGFLSVSIPWKNPGKTPLISASGAAAFFVIVYFWNPANRSAPVSPSPISPTSSPAFHGAP